MVEKEVGRLNKPLKERMKEFCKYHRDGDGECNAVCLFQYANNHSLSGKDRFDLSYFFSVVYCVESGIILFQNREAIKKDPEKAAHTLMPDMIFQSDRKYMRMRDRFIKALVFWKEALLNYSVDNLVNRGIIDLGTAVPVVERWYMFGRFSAFLFLETFATMLNAEVSNTTIDWKNGDTATSGLLNLFGDDAEANYFDQNGVLRVSVDKMNDRMMKTVFNVQKSGGDTNITKIETSLCAYRKFYKGTRYNGYYLDRMLEELIWYQENKPNYRPLTNEMFRIRGKCFLDEMLGERHGWKGIRKENKKLYMEYGII